MSVLRLCKAVYDAIRTHGEETYPNECCGALLGRSTSEGWQIEAAVKAGNTRTDSAHNRYQISPAELVKIERESRKQGLNIAGFYHSIRTILRNGRRLIWRKRIGWVVLM